MKPHIIYHMVSSLDGKILRTVGPMFLQKDIHLSQALKVFEPLVGLLRQLTTAPLNQNMTPPRQNPAALGRVNNVRFVVSSGALELLRV